MVTDEFDARGGRRSAAADNKYLAPASGHCPLAATAGPEPLR